MIFGTSLDQWDVMWSFPEAPLILRNFIAMYLYAIFVAAWNMQRKKTDMENIMNTGSIF